VEAVLGNKVAPGALDHYLARTGYEAQQTDQPVDPDRPNNLFKPLAGDHGAHGIFDEQASDFSTQLWITRRRAKLAVAIGAAIFAGFGMWKSATVR
jgi:hypothetical protein